jgi:DNA-directed RNA polymerase specialized sigma24 family protein
MTCRWRLIDRRRHDGCIPLVPLTDALSTDGAGTDEAAEYREVLAVVLRAVRSLPERDQQIYSLRMLRGFGLEEIQLLLDISPRSYRKRLQRTNKRVLAVLLERGIGGEPGCDRPA